MGRYYYGDNIEGKFWFAVQPSNDAEQFGAYENSGSVRYYADDAEQCKSRLDEIFAELRQPVDYDLGDDELIKRAAASDYEQAQLWASLQLGLKMYRCIKDNGVCEFEAEL